MIVIFCLRNRWLFRIKPLLLLLLLPKRARHYGCVLWSWPRRGKWKWSKVAGVGTKTYSLHVYVHAYVNYFILICELLLNHKVKNQFKMLFICYFTLAYELISISIYKSWFSNYGKASISQKGECLCCNMENSKFKKAFFLITDLDLLGYLSLHSGWEKF